MGTALSSILSLAIIAWMLGWLWHEYAVDSARQELFAMRDQLFDLARARVGGITFDEPAYHMLRTMLNGQIRFAPRFDFIGALALSVLTRRNATRLREQFDREWEMNVARLEPFGRTELENIRTRLHRTALRLSLLSVPHLALLVGIPFVVGLLGWYVVRALSQRTASAIPASVKAFRRRVESVVDQAAFDQGCPA